MSTLQMVTLATVCLSFGACFGAFIALLFAGGRR